MLATGLPYRGAGCDLVGNSCLMTYGVIASEALLRMSTLGLTPLYDVGQLRRVPPSPRCIAGGQFQPPGGRHTGHHDAIARVLGYLLVVSPGPPPLQEVSASTLPTSGHGESSAGADHHREPVRAPCRPAGPAAGRG